MNGRWLIAAACLAAIGCQRADQAKHRAEPAIADALVAQIPEDAIALVGYDAARAQALGLGEWTGAAGTPEAGGVFAISGAHAVTLLDPKLHPQAPPHRSELIDRAQAIAGGSVLWAVGRGSAIPKLPGNSENVGQLLRVAQWVTVTVHDSSAGKLRLEVTAECANGEVASLIEQTARASFALAASAERKRPELAAVLKAAQVERENATARVRLETSPGDLTSILSALH